MIYPRNFEDKTGFDRVRQMIRQYCLSPLGEYYVDKIRFSNNFGQLQILLGQTEEFRQLLEEESRFPSQDYFDLTSELDRVKTEGAYIAQVLLFDLKSSLRVITDVIRFIRNVEPDRLLNLKKLTEGIFVDKQIIGYISDIIDDKGEIRDAASSELKQIRNDLRSKMAGIDRRVNATLRMAKKEGWAAKDAEVAIRNGRPVIPVSVAYKRQINGFIHDESATGQTVFVEPAEIFETNNQIRELESAERREIIRILRAFTNSLRPEIPNLMDAYRFLGRIDFIRAKAKFAIEIEAMRPKLFNKQGLEWINAIHPLLFLTHKNLHKETVPLYVKLDEEQRILVISGPNAGGKSVCLKTIGLLQYMLQCGLLIPVKEGSKAGIFKNLFIDIGDEQSLENDLSTYSSHLLNMKHLLLNANNDTLFLIDEFGTGTEPVLGGAIAESVLESLNEKGAFGVVTTHYSNLKLMVRPGNGIINGAMMFDTKAMKPLYRLKMGNPGSSFAFEIAKSIGFPKKVLKKAESKTGKKQLDFDEQLQQLETEKRELAKKQQKYEIADDFLSEMIDKYEKLLKDIKSKKSEIIGNAGIEAARLLKSSNKLIENTIREIKEAGAKKEKTKKLRRDLEEKSKELEIKARTEKKSIVKAKTPGSKPEEPKVVSPIAKGDIVKILDQGVNGEVIERKGEDVIVEFNSVRLRTSVDKLKKAGSGAKTKISRSNRRGRQLMDQLSDKMASFELKLDIRGKRGEEAMSEIRHYIDDCILLGISEVKILHGKGFGILRQLIHDYLKTISQIKSFGDEHVERGGNGITVVRFR